MLQALQRVKRADSATNTMGGQQQRQLDSLRVVVSNPTDLVDMFREIVVHYSKYRHAGVIETEACIKAVHVLIEQVCTIQILIQRGTRALVNTRNMTHKGCSKTLTL